MSDNVPLNWAEPLCLVETDLRTGKPSLNQDTGQRLSAITCPLDVVAVVGLYRTGKSYILNLLAEEERGFDLGHTIQAGTKGIWIWAREHPVHKDRCLLLVDTEGLADVEKGSTEHDTLLFCLAVLMSNTFIYNSKGTIDQYALEKLQLVTNLCDFIQCQTDKDEYGEDFDKFFPSLIWTVRDFNLDLEKDGKKITADEYLDNMALAYKRAEERPTKATQEYNMLRECIKTYFPKRKCFTFPRPAHTEAQMAKLEDVPRDELNQDFLHNMELLKEYVFNSSECKRIEGAPINGRVLTQVLKTYVEDIIAKDKVPCIQNAIQMTAKTENSRVITESRQLYNDRMVESLEFPAESDMIRDTHKQCEKEAIQFFLKNAIFDHDHSFQKELAVSISNEYDQILMRNNEASRETCRMLLIKLYEPISEKVQAHVYMKPGGHAEYSSDMNKLITEFKNSIGTGPKDSEVLQLFMKDKENERITILVSDQKLGEEAKKIEELKLLREQAEMEKEAQELLAEQQRQRLDEVEQSRQEHRQQLQFQLDEEREHIYHQNEMRMALRTREHKDLLDANMKEKAQLIRQQLDELGVQQGEIESGKNLFVWGQKICGAAEAALFLAARAGTVVHPSLFIAASAGSMLFSLGKHILT